MSHRIASLVLALGLGIATPVALAADASSPAPQPAPAGPMGGKAGPGMGPMGGHGGPGGMGGMGGRKMMREKPESFTEETVRKMADGRVFKHTIEQKVEEGSFVRKDVFTNPDGKTASRTVTSTLNKERSTWTQRVDGVDYDGATWSRSKDLPAHRGPDADDDATAPAPAKRPAKDAARPAKKAN